MSASRFTAEVRNVVLIVTAIQFVHIVDFMMVAPLGPDFVKAIHIQASQIGVITGSYGAFAALSTIVAAFFIDRFERRKVIALAMCGLAVGTIAAAFATDLWSMVLGRIIAGFFGGPATAVALAMIIDVVPEAQRGRAIGIAMGAFSIAAVLGVPIGLELAHWFNWQMPFFAVGGLAFLVVILMYRFVPPMITHMNHPAMQGRKFNLDFFVRKESLVTLSLTAVSMIAAFIVIPNISAFVQFNRGYPREQIGVLYLFGGALSFFVVRYAGRLIDEWGNVKLALLSTVFLVLITLFGFVVNVNLPVIVIFCGFMMAMSARNVIATSVASRVPKLHERAGFMSLNSAVQHISAALGAFLSSLLLSEDDHGALIGMSSAAALALLLSASFPWFVSAIEKLLRQRTA